MLKSVWIAGLFCASVAGAQEVPPETLLSSNALFAQGKRELSANQIPAACASFAESHRLLPRGGTLLNLGLCREQEGQLAEAWRVLRAALAVAQREAREDRVPLAREHIAALESRLSFASVALPHDIDPSLVALRLDGGAIAREEWNGVPLAPGEHTFSAEAVGFQRWSTKLTIGEVPTRLVVPIGPLVPTAALPLETPPEAKLPSPQPLSTTPLHVDRPEDPAVRSARLAEQRLALEGWFVELGIGFTGSRLADPYVKTLRAFDYDDTNLVRLNADAALGMMLSRRFGVVFHYDRLESRRYQVGADSLRPPAAGSGERYVFSWQTQAVMAGVRFRQPIASHWLVFFAEATAGLAFTRSALEYETRQGASYLPQRDNERDRSVALRGLAGLDVGFVRHFGAFLAAGYAYAPTLTNEIGETHNGGGPVFLTGLRVNSVKGWW
ncbi:MAG TPA: hypothetical protein VI299_25630 [Polyangiales bacterium]